MNGLFIEELFNMGSIGDMFLTYKLVELDDILPINIEDYVPYNEHILRAKTFRTSNETPTQELKKVSWLGWDIPAGVSTNSTSSEVGTPSAVKLALKSDRFKEFNQVYDLYLLTHPEDNDPTMRAILTNIAGLESGYRADVKNPSSTATGYFQFIDSTRTRYTNLSREEFKKDKVELIASAIRLYKSIYKHYIQPNASKIQERGLTLTLAVYGYWFRPASMVSYLKNGYDDFKDPLGTSLAKIFNKIGI